MKKFFSIGTVLVMLVTSVLPASALAQTAEAPAATATGGKPQKKAAVKKALKKAVKKTARPVFVAGSAETVAQRSARLKRECKGGVNAGACAGYTR